MNQKLRQNANQIIASAIHAVLPDQAVMRALKYVKLTGKVYLVAAGKAAWQMSKAACDTLGERINKGVICTKYGHVMGDLPRCVCYEGGHPVPDENSVQGTLAALELVKGLSEDDVVLFLLSGGGSALFENPLIPLEEMQDITRQLLASGANIVEINTIRKRLSAVKGGRFAKACSPAKLLTIVLSDVLGDPLDMISSGPAYPDQSTCEQALAIVQRYGLRLSERAMILLHTETPKQLENVETHITGSVRELCRAAEQACEKLGYTPYILTDCLDCQAREAGRMLAAIARTHADRGQKLAYIMGGETVVRLIGTGLGGRNQELAIAAASGIANLPNVAVFSVGSDGTDGPTDAAGGYVDGDSMDEMMEKGIHVFQILDNNDAYNALKMIDGLIKTGPTGTNVNDVAIALIDEQGCRMYPM